MSETLKATIQADLHESMRARDAVRSGTLRMVLAAITTEEVAGESARELTDPETLKVVAKEAKKRKEALAAYQEAQRPELAEREAAELAVIEHYLPEQLSEEQVEEAVRAAIDSTGATGMAQMGQVMKAAQTTIAGRADGGVVAAVVKRLLA